MKNTPNKKYSIFRSLLYWPQCSCSYRLFFEFDTFTHTTSQSSCLIWRICIQLFNCVYTLTTVFKKKLNYSQTLFWRKERYLFVQTVVQKWINLILLMEKIIKWPALQYCITVHCTVYRVGRAWERLISRKRQ